MLYFGSRPQRRVFLYLSVPYRQSPENQRGFSRDVEVNLSLSVLRVVAFE